MRLAFLGTPTFAADVLAGLIDARVGEVALVVCQPDRPAGRGRKTRFGPVKELALRAGLAVAQPEKVKGGSLAMKIGDAAVDLTVVAAYGRILPPDALAAAKLGAWNVHASLLPRHRGASPVAHAILAGDEITGVSLMQMTEGLDEGPVMLVRETHIDAADDAGTLTKRLARDGAALLVDGLRRLQDGTLPEAIPQDASRATYAPLLEKEDGRLALRESAAQLARTVRAMSPWPGAYVLKDGQPFRICAAEATAPGTGTTPGTVVRVTADRIELATGDGFLAILAVQPAGRRRMTVREYLAGRPLQSGALFS